LKRTRDFFATSKVFAKKEDRLCGMGTITAARGKPKETCKVQVALLCAPLSMPLFLYIITGDMNREDVCADVPAG
jgi:hypothetical protein